MSGAVHTPVAALTPRELAARLAIYSCRAEPITPEGWTVPNGYVLRGPRGNRHTVQVDHNGNVAERDIDLWLKGIAMVDARMLARSNGGLA